MVFALPEGTIVVVPAVVKLLAEGSRMGIAVLPLLKVMVPFPTLLANVMEEPAARDVATPEMMARVLPSGRVMIPLALVVIVSVPGVPLGKVTAVSGATVRLLLVVLS